MEQDLACHHAGKLSPKESEAVLNRPSPIARRPKLHCCGSALYMAGIVAETASSAQ